MSTNDAEELRSSLEARNLADEEYRAIQADLHTLRTEVRTVKDHMGVCLFVGAPPMRSA